MMRIAWFRHGHTDAANPFDGTAALIDELRSLHDISVVEEASAHDFVWQQFQRPSHLCVFELDSTRAHQFIWGYLPNYPGVVLLHSVDVVNLRVAMLASRAVVVSDSGLAERLQGRFPQANVRYAPACGGPGRSAPDVGQAARSDPPIGQAGSFDQLTGHRRDDRFENSVVKFAVYDRWSRGRHLINRAFERARHAGAAFEVLEGEPTADVLARADVVIAPSWPPFHSSQAPLLAAMAAGKPVITTEMETTGEWPAIDPQTWRPRGLAVEEPPVAVTVDPRDEEHSLMLAIRRLSADATLRYQLGRAARVWWEAYATPARAASAWTAILQEAASLSPPRRPDDWPKQFLMDGTGLARDILGEFGLASDLYEPLPDPLSADPGSPIPDPGSRSSQS
jgi:hypothetical protein